MHGQWIHPLPANVYLGGMHLLKVTETNEVPVLGNYDVIVAGGGPAGVGAAVSAARHGMSVLVVERFGCLGGMWTAGLVNPLFDYENKGGIVQEIVDRINALGMNSHSGSMYTFDMETMKLLLDRLMKENGVDVLFHTYVAKPYTEGNVVKGLFVENKSGRGLYTAKRLVDCTGDGDVAARAGAPYTVGRPGDAACQPMTTMFKVGNADYVQRYDYPYGNGNELFDMMKAAVQREGIEYDFNFERPCLLNLPGNHTGVMQMTHMRGYNPLDAVSLSKAEMEGRERVYEAMRFFKAYLPQFEHAQLEQTAQMIGIRESRHITGEYQLTLEDMVEGRRFDDGFATCCFNVDIHQPDGKSQEEAKRYKIKPYQLPYRSLVPLKAENILVAGRAISGSYEAHASYRVTGDCVAMGQAAGIACALSVNNGCAFRTLDGSHVAKLMEQDGARL